MYPENGYLYRIIDNPEYFDRYTLAFVSSDNTPFTVLTSADPFHYDSPGHDPGDVMAYSGVYVSSDQDMGEEIGFDDLPEPVQRYAAMIEG